MRKFLYSILFILLGVLAMKAKEAQKGVLDLRDHDFSKEKIISLEGDWEFYWKELINPEDFIYGKNLPKPDYMNFLTRWGDLPQLLKEEHQFGYATYRLKIICPDSMPPVTFNIPEVYSSYALYINGDGFEGNGKVGKSRQESVPYWRPSSKALQLKPGMNEMVMQISNFDHHKGGAIRPIEMGMSDQINYKRNFDISSTLFLAGCLLIAGALAMGLYWFNRTDYSGLFFSLFCFAYTYRILGTDQYVIHAAMRFAPWSFTLRLEYISLYISVISYSYFIRNLISLRVKPVFFHIVAVISGILVLATMILPTYIFTSFIDFYLVFLGLAMGYLAFNHLVNINLRHKMTYVTLIGIGSLFVVLMIQVLVYFKVLQDKPFLVTGGYVVFIFSQAVALAIRFGRNFRESFSAAQLAARSKSQFLNTMSHELRTPMNAIMGMTEFLERTELNNQQHEKIDTIKKNSESLMSIIMDILSISELESGQINLEKKPLNLRECIEGGINLALRERKDKPIDLEIDIDSDIPNDLIGDSIRFKQVFMHLVGNAFKFTEEGVVRISGEVKSSNDKQVELLFSIKDTGIGIPKNNIGGIFSTFFQGQDGNTRRYGGTGLGLTVVKELVRLMGGKVEVDSKKDRGTNVYFNVKLGIAKLSTISRKPVVERQTEVDKQLKVLYAEDNPVNQKLLAMMIKTMGIEIDLASNGLEAVEKARKKQYNIILMDIQMPEMDGFEATRNIIVSMQKNRPIIIAVTANATLADKKKCFEAGMNDFITKPIKADELKQTLLKWQGLREYMEDAEQAVIKLSS